ncbi:TPA_asm: maturation protein [ssRNA phage SRR7976325_20]|uniref:Maturation protein n=1 Tax=ssRNA phage SRR7976325_20 TaxID=2786708 RepID=A0A8S5L5P2_9VIRU|nr:maturation protein [ssRNA phage SRR7976325_20]DAD52783.1 TPA_asm: maturation protein [ssRNA phage SRR7976325_20]
MVTPVTETIGSGGWFKSTTRYRQRKPYRSALPYIAHGTSCNYASGHTGGQFYTVSHGAVWGFGSDESPPVLQARAKAYDKIIGKLRGEAGAMLAVNVAERKQSLDMIAKRGGQLLSAVRAFRKFDIPSALGHLGFKLRLGTKRREATWVRKGKGRTYSLPAKKVELDTYRLRRRVKKVGSLWLEYHFGWAPLLSDIHGAIDVLQDKQFAFRKVFSGAATVRTERSVNQPWYYQSQWWANQETLMGSFGCRYQCRMEISSPNALKASQLGMVNPASVAWELIPFSFLVDWFLPVGRFLDSYTDTVGMSIFDIQRMERREASHTKFLTSPWGRTDDKDQAFSVQRTLPSSLPIPGIMDRRGTGIASLSRGATAIALLAGFFKSSKWS